MKGVKSKDILLSVNIGTEQAPSWLKVGCSTSDGFSSSRDAVAVSTKCSGDFVENLPGEYSWSFSNSSYVDKDSDNTFATLAEIMDISKEDTNRQWKLESLDTEFPYEITGLGFISDLSNTADQGDYLTFDITITGSGEPAFSFTT